MPLGHHAGGARPFPGRGSLGAHRAFLLSRAVIEAPHAPVRHLSADGAKRCNRRADSVLRPQSVEELESSDLAPLTLTATHAAGNIAWSSDGGRRPIKEWIRWRL